MRGGIGGDDGGDIEGGGIGGDGGGGIGGGGADKSQNLSKLEHFLNNN